MITPLKLVYIVSSLVILLATPGLAQGKEIKGLAVLGDSHSDEYTADDNRGDPKIIINWVEILQRHRNLNFGKWDSWGEPRRTGFEYNWARSGATSWSFLEQGQHSGVAQQVKAGKVNTVILFIGSNDFAHYDPGSYRNIYNGILKGPELDKRVEDIAQNVATAVKEIKQAGDAEVLIVEIWDWGKQVQVQRDFSDPEKRERVSQAINKTNKRVRQLSQEHDFYTIDPNPYYENLFRNSAKVKINDFVLNRSTYGNNPNDEFLGDYIHAGTILNVLFSNFIIESLNENLDTDIKAFDNQELLKIAGVGRD